MSVIKIPFDNEDNSVKITLWEAHLACLRSV